MGVVKDRVVDFFFFSESVWVTLPGFLYYFPTHFLGNHFRVGFWASIVESSSPVTNSKFTSDKIKKRKRPIVDVWRIHEREYDIRDKGSNSVK